MEYNKDSLLDKGISEKQKANIKDISTVDCFVCKDGKKNFEGNKGGDYSKLIY